MEALYPRCAGLDVHKDTVVAAVRLAGAGAPTRAVETFSTTTPGLMALSEWLDEHGCACVAMEATGVYWRPVWHVLSADGRTLILANAAHVKNVPGRRTDVADAVWLSDLLAHGLIRASFVPEAETQVMRTLLRTRKQLIREQASHVQRIQNTLEDANLKLASVLTDIMGQSGRAVLDALVAGERDPARLSGLVGSRVKAGREAIRAALTGRIGDPHRFLLGRHLRQDDALAVAVAEIDAQVERDLDPFRDAAGLLATIPGVSDLTAQGILPGHPLRDRPRHEPLPHRRPPDLLGRPRPEQRRDCRQASLDPPEEGRPLAQDHPDPVRLGRRAQEAELSPGPVPAPAPPTPTQEGRLRGRRLHPHRRLPHAQGRDRLRRPRG